MASSSNNGPGGPSGTGGGPKGPLKDTLRPPLPKRFYKAVALGPRPPGQGHEIHLDGRPVRTPRQRLLVIADEGFATRVRDEWAAQGDVVDPGTMPAARLANSAVDTVADHRAAVAAEVVAFAGSDLLCYRASAPAGLVARQSALWDPILSDVEAAIGARFVRAEGVMHAAQPALVLERFSAAIADLSDLSLAGLQLVTTLTGSAILALALCKGLASADAVWAAAHVDEDWQIAQWGRDEEAEARRALREMDFRAAAAALAISR